MIQILKERHETPAEVERIITRAGGITPPGYRLLPRFRVVWGWSRMGWTPLGCARGEWASLYAPPIHNPNRWYLEKWCPPELYGRPEAWLERELGPYPSDGDYEHVLTLEDPVTHEFVPLSVGTVEQMIQVLEFSRGFRMSERKAALEKREAQKDRDFERQGYDILDDAVPAMHGAPFVVLPKSMNC